MRCLHVIFVLLVASLSLQAVCQSPFKKPILAKGVFVDKNSHNAFDIATLLAQENLAKQITKVLQTETTTIETDAFKSKLHTSFSSDMDSFSIVSKRYDAVSHRAEVIIEMQAEKANELLCR